MKAVWICDRGKALLDTVYTQEAVRRLEEKLQFTGVITSIEELQAPLVGVEYAFSTWGMLALTREQIRTYLPDLKAVFYGAGSVQSFAAPFLDCGVRVFSSAAANAVPVAEYTVAQILLANKGFYQAARLYKEGNHQAAQRHSAMHPGNYDAVIGIIGAGMIGKLVIRSLREHRLSILCFDPFLPDEAATDLGVRKVSLETVFAESDVISNHLANNPQTVGMLNARLFSRMKDHAVFINTGRGAQVVEEDLCQALREKPGRTAVLDVTMPEPVREGHPFYTMPNVFLTPHIAGSMGRETARMGDYQVQAFFDLLEGRPLTLEVTRPMLATMA